MDYLRNVKVLVPLCKSPCEQLEINLEIEWNSSGKTSYQIINKVKRWKKTINIFSNRSSIIWLIYDKYVSQMESHTDYGVHVFISKLFSKSTFERQCQVNIFRCVCALWVPLYRWPIYQVIYSDNNMKS